MQGWSMRIFFPLGRGLFTRREVGKWRKRRSIFGPNPENIKVVPINGSKTKMRDVGCDRMVFAINSDLFSIKFYSFFNKWSLDQGQKAINRLIPYPGWPFKGPCGRHLKMDGWPRPCMVDRWKKKEASPGPGLLLRGSCFGAQCFLFLPSIHHGWFGQY